jgi:hypothetical protein
LKLRSLLHPNRIKNYVNPRRLLIGAAIFHVAFTLAVFATGKYRVLPQAFDANGNAVSVAPDSVMFHDAAVELSQSLWRGEVGNWLQANQTFHAKLYSICFAVLGPFAGNNIVTVEPLNVLCYVTILIMVFYISREAFNARAAIWAAAIVACWPSLLLHTTQLVRDALFLALALAVILLVVRWNTRIYSWTQALIMAAVGMVLATVVWLERAEMGILLVGTVLLGALTLAIVLARQWPRGAANAVGMILLVMVTIAIPFLIPEALRLGRPRGRSGDQDSQQLYSQRKAQRRSRGRIETVLQMISVARINEVRRDFAAEYVGGSGSNIDSDVRLENISAVARYLPRAAEIGFFAPFPYMWLASGSVVGSAGRRLAGIESVGMYLIELVVLIGLWIGRGKLLTWFLFAVACMGVTALGLVVPNIGALYRLRYLFLILFIILAAGGLVTLVRRLRHNAIRFQQGSMKPAPVEC